MKSEIGVRKWCVCVRSESGVRKSGMWVGSVRVESGRWESERMGSEIRE